MSILCKYAWAEQIGYGKIQVVLRNKWKWMNAKLYDDIKHSMWYDDEDDLERVCLDYVYLR